MSCRIEFETLIAIMIVAAGISTVSAGVVVVGEDVATLSNWRTAAALEADNEYGTDGYVLYGINSPDGTWTSPYDATSLVSADVIADSQVMLPSYITDIGLGDTTGRWSGNGNFGQIEDPAAANTLTNTAVLAHGPQPYLFTLTRATNDAFRLAIMLADGDGGDLAWDTSVNAGAAGNASITGTAINGTANQTYHVYDIGAGADPIVVSITSPREPGLVTGFAFDAVPEPSSLLLVGVALLGMIVVARRRR